MIFNEYTRHILRWRGKMQAMSDLVAYCYAAFSRLYPGRMEGLRAELAASEMRPNVRRKLLDLLDDVERAQVYLQQITIGRIDHMGDKYENIEVSQSQGVAIGRGAHSAVSDSVNRSGDPHLVSALKDLASRVRATDNEDADLDAELIEKAAAKAEAGDEKGAVGALKKVGSWALGIAATAGSAALTGFLKTHGLG
jgi:hypothetical protein